jgi:hypothetical protein
VLLIKFLLPLRSNWKITSKAYTMAQLGNIHRKYFAPVAIVELNSIAVKIHIMIVTILATNAILINKKDKSKNN